jgi:hypothetical protein
MAKNGVSKSSSPEIDRILAKETSNKQVKVFVTTWNVGNAEPKGFEQVFKQPNANHLDEFEIFAIGLQESTYAVSGGTSLIGLNGVHESITHFSQQVLPDIFPESQFFLVRAERFFFCLILSTVSNTIGRTLCASSTAVICLRKGFFAFSYF